MTFQRITMDRAIRGLELLLLLYNVVSCTTFRVSSEYVPQNMWVLVEDFQRIIPFHTNWDQHVFLAITGLAVQLLKCFASCWKYWSYGRWSPNRFRSVFFWIMVTCAWLAVYKLGEDHKVVLLTTVLIGLLTTRNERPPASSSASGRIMDDAEQFTKKPKHRRTKATVKPFLGDLKHFKYSPLTGRRSAPPVLASEPMELDYHPGLCDYDMSERTAEPTESMEGANSALGRTRRSSIKELISDGMSAVHKLLYTDETAVRMGANDVDRDSRASINRRDSNAKTSFAKYLWPSLKGAVWLAVSFSVTYGIAFCCGFLPSLREFL